MKLNRFVLGAVLLAASALSATSPFGDFASKQTLNYSGVWNNTTFSSTDTYAAELVLDGYEFDLTVTIQGWVYGVGIQIPLNFSGTLEEDGTTTFMKSFPVYGDCEATLDFTKNPAELTASSTPTEQQVSHIAPSTATATFDFLQMSSTFVVNFQVGDPANGTSVADLVEMTPHIVTIPDSVYVTPGQTTILVIDAEGSLLKVQWFTGASGDDSNPIQDADELTYKTPPVNAEQKYWARLTNHLGTAVDSPTITAIPQDAPAALFTPGPSDPQGFHDSDWFGMVYIQHAPWFIHTHHNALYSESVTQDSIWFNDSQLGWFWTNSTCYPFLYTSSDAWLYYFEGTDSPRKFYDFSQSKHVSFP